MVTDVKRIGEDPIGFERSIYQVRSSLQHFFTTRRDDHFSSGSCERFAERTSNPSATSRDNRDLFGERPSIHLRYAVCAALANAARKTITWSHAIRVSFGRRI